MLHERTCHCCHPYAVLGPKLCGLQLVVGGRSEPDKAMAGQGRFGKGGVAGATGVTACHSDLHASCELKTPSWLEMGRPRQEGGSGRVGGKMAGTMKSGGDWQAWGEVKGWGGGKKGT